MKSTIDKTPPKKKSTKKNTSISPSTLPSNKEILQGRTELLMHPIKKPTDAFCKYFDLRWNPLPEEENLPFMGRLEVIDKYLQVFDRKRIKQLNLMSELNALKRVSKYYATTTEEERRLDLSNIQQLYDVPGEGIYHNIDNSDTDIFDEVETGKLHILCCLRIMYVNSKIPSNIFFFELF